MVTSSTLKSKFVSKRARFITTALVCVAYLAAFLVFDLISRQFQQSEGIVAWYPPVGITYAFLFIFGIRFMPVVLLALVSSSILVFRFPYPLYMHVAWGIFMALVYSLAAEILRKRIGQDRRLEHARSVVWLILVAVITSAGLAYFNVTLVLSGGMSQSEILNSLLHWWIGEMVGILSITPFLLIYVTPWLTNYLENPIRKPYANWKLPRLDLTTLGELAAFAILFYLIFGLDQLSDFNPPYLLILPLIWVTLRHGMRGGVTAVLLVNFGVVIALRLTNFGLENLSDLQLLMVINCIAGLVFGTVVTGRKQAEQALRTSEQKFAKAFLSSPDAIIISAVEDGRYIEVNDNFLRQTGYTRAETIGQDSSQIWGKPEDFENLLAELNQRGRVSNLGMQYRRKSGELRDAEISAELIELGNGQKCVLAVARDVSEMKRVQLELEQLNDSLEERVRLRTAEAHDLYENAPTGYHSLDAQGCIVMINRTELVWLGYTLEEMLGKPLRDFMTPTSQAKFAQTFPEFKAHGNLSGLELDFVRKNGSILPVATEASAVYDAQGNYVMSRSVLSDISRRKQAEEELRANKELLQGVIDYSPALIYILDTEGRFLLLNRPLEKMLGVLPGQLLGQTRTSFLPEHIALQHRKNDLEIIHNGRSMSFEEANLQPDGLHYYLSTKFPLLDANNQVAAICGISTDITERKQVEINLRDSRDQLREANAALERASKLKDEFLASMSHELRTPLTGILGLSEALQYQTYGALNEKQLKALSNIESSGRHLLALINDVLDLSKMGAEKLDLDILPCSVNEICQASLQLTRGVALQKGLSVSFSARPVSAVVNADPRRFKQMLVNLLSNAVKFTPAGGSLGLEVVGDEDNHQIHLSVWDKGIGIKTEDLELLFNPFTQLDSSLARHYAGTGLGLSLVSKLAELHGGSIQVESTFGEGSRFTLTLPWLPPAKPVFSAEGEAENNPLRPRLVSQGKTKGSILLVDDDEVILETMGDFLSQQGYQLFKARSGKELVDLAPAIQVDMILTDIQMPGMDGVQAIRQIRAHPDERLQRVPIIAVTALAMPGDEGMCLAAGANKYISKPVSLRSLAENWFTSKSKRCDAGFSRVVPNFAKETINPCFIGNAVYAPART